MDDNSQLRAHCANLIAAGRIALDSLNRYPEPPTTDVIFEAIVGAEEFLNDPDAVAAARRAMEVKI